MRWDVEAMVCVDAPDASKAWSLVVQALEQTDSIEIVTVDEPREVADE